MPSSPMGQNVDMAPGVATERRCCILGTAGHIDHGKSALVKALTGTDPDRLPQEKARGMTIELGFARLRLPVDGGGAAEEIEVGIVDVPGHERFVRTMVAGATGVDLGLLAVAADDGVMPQTREHVDILDLLNVEKGVIAITKADVSHDQRIEEVSSQIKQLTASSSLSDWPVVVTSAKTGRGLDELREQVRNLIGKLPPRKTHRIFRLAIDRVFAIRGRGTVVTGSVLSGQVAASATLELQPPGLSCKVREVQSHGAAVKAAGGGQRAALNLTGIDRETIERGMELATPGYLTKTRYIDVRVRMLSRAGRPFNSHQRVRVCMATSEAMAMLVVIGADRIEPGGDAAAQLRFLRPVVADFGQRFIMRSETSQATIGGGVVVRPISRRVRPMHPETLRTFEQAESTDAFVRFSEAVRRGGFEPYSAERLACETGIGPQEVSGFHKRLEEEHKLVQVGNRQVHRDTLGALENRAVAYLKRHHANHPSEPGVLRDRFIGWIESRTAKALGRPIFDHLAANGMVSVRGPYVAHHAFRAAVSEEDAALVEQLVREIGGAGVDPPEWAKLGVVRSLSKQRTKALADLARIEPRLVSFGAGRYISAEALDRFKGIVRDLGAGGKKFKLAQVRDAVGQSRRVVQPLLEYLDRIGMTRRVGDERILIE